MIELLISTGAWTRTPLSSPHCYGHRCLSCQTTCNRTEPRPQIATGRQANAVKRLFLCRHASRRSRKQHFKGILSEAGAAGSPQHYSQKVLKFTRNQYLPLVLISSILLGLLYPAAGVRAAAHGLQTWTTMGIFIISGLALRQGDARKALTAWGPIAYGLSSVLLLTPLAALLVLRLPLQPPELTFGLAVFCFMPTTLSTAVSLTQAVGGNAALALLLTIATNILGIVTMPFMLSLLLIGDGFHLAPWPLLLALLRTILIPTLVGVCLRATVPGLARAVDSNKKGMGMLSATLLAMVPWMQISKATQANVVLSPASLAATVVASAGLHAVFLALNTCAVSLLPLTDPSNRQAAVGTARALILVGSQKTLPIAVTVLGELSGMLSGPVGLAIIACVTAHLVQILMDTVIVSHWLRSA